MSSRGKGNASYPSSSKHVFDAQDLQHHDMGEHEDSPQRKRARRGSSPIHLIDDSPTLPGSGHIEHNVSGASTLDQNNLGPHAHPINFSFNTGIPKHRSSPPASELSPHSFQSSNSPTLPAFSPSGSSSKSLPVAEIYLDEPADNADVVMAPDVAPLAEAQMLERFPLASDLGLEMALKTIPDTNKHEMSALFPQNVRAVKSWMLAWKHYTNDQPRLALQQIYDKTRPFWTSVGAMMLRILKINPDTVEDLSATYLESDITSLFSIYLKLCADILASDQVSLDRSGSIIESLHESLYLSQLETLYLLINGSKDTILWKLWSESSRLRRNAYMKEWTEWPLAAIPDNARLETLADLLTYATDSSKLSKKLFITCHRLLMIFSKCTAAHMLLASEDHELEKRIAYCAASVFKDVHDFLARAFQCADAALLDLDTMVDIYRAMSQIVNTCVAAHLQICPQLGALTPAESHALVENNVASTASLIYKLDLLWMYIQKGHMEIRLLGASTMGNNLMEAAKVDTFVTSGTKQCICRFFDTRKVVFSLTGQEGHPELLGSCSAIFGFVFNFELWTDDMTNSTWEVLLSSSDLQMTGAIASLLGRCVRYMSEDIVTDFIFRARSLPWAVSCIEHLKLARQLLRKRLLTLQAQPDTEKWHDSFILCLVMLQESWACGSPNVNSFKEKMKEETCNILDALYKLGHSETIQLERLLTYCLLPIRERTKQTTGCYAVLLHLLKNSDSGSGVLSHQDEGNYFWSLQSTILGEINDYVEASIPPVSQSRLESFRLRMEFIHETVIQGWFDSGPCELELRFWQHLVGDKVTSGSFRQTAWSSYSMVLDDLISNDRRSSHVDRLIKEYLPVIPRACYTVDCMDFIRAAMAYQRHHQQQEQQPDSDIQTASVRIAWNVILFAPTDEIFEKGSLMMVASLASCETLGLYSPSSRAHLHQRTVEKLIEELKDTSDFLTGLSTQIPNTDAPPALTMRCKFKRILKFLIHLVHGLRSDLCLPYGKVMRSRFSQFIVLNSGSDCFDNIDQGTDVVDISFQAFSLTVCENQKRLRLSTSATYADLYNAFTQVTTFSTFKCFHLGKELDLLADPTASIKSILGSVLVQNVSDKQLVPRDERGCPIVEVTLIAHSGTLISLLDTELSLSEQVFELLWQLPMSDPSVTSARSNAASPSTLFPISQPFKTLFRLNVIQATLNEDFQIQHLDIEWIVGIFGVIEKAFEDPDTVNLAFTQPVERKVTINFITCFGLVIQSLRQRSGLAINGDLIVPLPSIFALKRLADLIRKLPKMTVDFSLRLKTFETLVHSTLDHHSLWTNLINDDQGHEILYSLLLEPSFAPARHSALTCICHMLSCFQNSQTIDASSDLNCWKDFFWKVCESLFSRCKLLPSQSKEVFNLATILLAAHYIDETKIQQWQDLLLGYQPLTRTTPKEAPHDFINGIGTLINHAMSLSPVVADRTELLKGVIRRFLFPDMPHDTIQDSMTRSILYRLILTACKTEHEFGLVTDELRDLLMPRPKQVSTHCLDRRSLLRSSSGLVGLRNIFNTCYMNALISQLYMTASFRHFIERAEITSEEHQQLLRETKNLFMAMRSSKSKYVDTEPFTKSIKPYDGTHIDPIYQMDVDEFFNLVQHRWESELLHEDDVKAFRSIFGGQVTSQIKSMDCDHVSEHTEAFSAVACDVKGLESLQESLKALVQGEVMEGDNKYKCEACLGRLVNAVKRSCFKSLPNNLIFHLKRFEFDLNTLERYKINDEFEFPDEIDMMPYTHSYLMEGGAMQKKEPDVFDLVGVLIHDGTAESGHYYSIIRTGRTPNSPPEWVLYNDIDVREYDRSQKSLGYDSFGGPENSPKSNTLKRFSAYMLFYERRGEHFANRDAFAHSQSVKSDNRDISRPGTPCFVQEENCALVRWFCLLDPEHGYFTKFLIEESRNCFPHGPNLSPSQHAVKRRIILLGLEYISKVAIHSLSHTVIDNVLCELVYGCRGCMACCTFMLNWFLRHSAVTQGLLLNHGFQQTRAAVAKCVISIIREAKSITENVSSMGNSYALLVSSTFDLLMQIMPIISRYIHKWDTYFELWAGIVKIGRTEAALALETTILQDCFLLMMLHDSLSAKFKPAKHIMNSKRLSELNGLPSCAGITQLISNLLDWAHPFQVSSFAKRLSDPSTNRFHFTPFEQSLCAIDGQDSHNLISRICDFIHENLSDAEWAPGLIIRTLVECCPKAELASVVGNTLAMNIEDAPLNSAENALRIAHFFCTSCPEAKNMRKILYMAATSANNIDATHPGQARKKHVHVSFFEAIHEGLDFKCLSAQNGAAQLIRELRASLAHCAFTLMLDQSFSVRQRARELVESVFFGPIPSEQVSTLEAYNAAVANRSDAEGCAATEPMELDASKPEEMQALVHHGTVQFKLPFVRRLQPQLTREAMGVLHSCCHWLRGVVDKGYAIEDESRLNRASFAQDLTATINAAETVLQGLRLHQQKFVQSGRSSSSQESDGMSREEDSSHSSTEST